MSKNKRDYEKRAIWIESIEQHTAIYADWSSLKDEELEQLQDYIVSNYQENDDW